MRKLKYILDYQLSSSLLMFLSAMWPILLLFAFVASMLFTPYMLNVLYKEKKYGWIISFFVYNVLLTSINFLPTVPSIAKGAVNLIVLASFYLYCTVLRYEVVDWIKERIAKEQMESKMINSSSSNSYDKEILK